MRLWTLHPRYLDPQGLVALWREALLARAVLRGETRGYLHHPQLQRFREQALPRSAINAYLAGVHVEANTRGYAFDASKFSRVRSPTSIAATSGQLDYEWTHLLRKLEMRNTDLFERWRKLRRPEAHPIFRVVPGPIADWERPDG